MFSETVKKKHTFTNTVQASYNILKDINVKPNTRYVSAEIV